MDPSLSLEMKKIVRGISISHESASFTSRECYHFDASTRNDLAKAIKSNFPDIHGLILLSTCNRTELYFESLVTEAVDVACFLIQKLNPAADLSGEKEKFQCFDTSIETAHYLLQMANGLRSAVIGDGQILSQVRQAYQHALAQGLQGSVLERIFQAVFRSHKRISNTTNFKKGSRSVAYRALKLIEKTFGKSQLADKKLLIVGAGEVVLEVLKYLPKFSFKEVHIVNRTMVKAVKLAQQNGLKVYDWNKAESGDYENFDIIITAVSNKRSLIKDSFWTSSEKVVIADLALPANTDATLAMREGVTLFNIDEIAQGMAQSDAIDPGTIAAIDQIIEAELRLVEDWLKNTSNRTFLKGYKQQVTRLIQQTIKKTPELNPDRDEVNRLVDHMVRKVVKKSSTIENKVSAEVYLDHHLDFIPKVTFEDQ